MKVVKLGDVASIDRQIIAPSDLEPSTSYLGLEHIAQGGQILDSETIGSSGVRSSKFRFTSDHILYGKLRPYLAKISRPSFSGVCSTDILAILPGRDLDRNYLNHYLLQPNMVDYASSRATGANLPRLSPNTLAGFPVPLPPLEDQRRIAAILDKVDSLRAKRREAISHLESLPQAIFREMYQGGDPGAWPLLRVGELVSSIESGSSPKCESRPALDGEYGVLKLGAVTYGDFRPSENKAYLGSLDDLRVVEVNYGDVLMTRKNTLDLVGAVAVVDQLHPRLILPDLIFRLNFVPGIMDAHFFQTMMMSSVVRPRVRQLAGGSAASMSNISKQRLSGLVVPVPPIEQQRAFSRVVEDAKARLHRMTLQAKALDELFASLQSRAFKGEL
ncbi:restriction endonuclease subunit S [Kocuria sp.]|uniref:restriction endonuclease subunit S n=1 Tax=Kocuria sp. TaxID=1871328 RepID=UPI0026DF54D8|nr:restriction endonuclease subunit S [Kocuria sp.]MDO5618002.1 restriction endonuclease subunit S [Kocuria sp.]